LFWACFSPPPRECECNCVKDSATVTLPVGPHPQALPALLVPPALPAQWALLDLLEWLGLLVQLGKLECQGDKDNKEWLGLLVQLGLLGALVQLG